uniref:Uncharacterized protein n=1 Tax=Arundo donax TaxID=35708 RepID=A0A0A8ZH49_ARUDO
MWRNHHSSCHLLRSSTSRRHCRCRNRCHCILLLGSSIPHGSTLAPSMRVFRGTTTTSIPSRTQRMTCATTTCSSRMRWRTWR